MESFHYKQLSVYRIMKLIYQRRRPGNRRIRKQDVPSRIFSRYPSPDSTTIVFAREAFNVLNEPLKPLSQRAIVRGFPRVVSKEDAAELTPERLAHRFGHPLDLGRSLKSRVEHAVG